MVAIGNQLRQVHDVERSRRVLLPFDLEDPIEVDAHDRDAIELRLIRAAWPN